MDESPPPYNAYSENMMWMKPPPPDYAYSVYVICMKLPPPDNTYSESRIWMKHQSPLTTPTLIHLSIPQTHTTGGGVGTLILYII